MKIDFTKLVQLYKFPQNLRSIFLSGSNESYLEYCKDRLIKLSQNHYSTLNIDKCTVEILLEHPEKTQVHTDLFADYVHKLLIVEDPVDKLTLLLTEFLNHDSKDVTFIFSCAISSKAKKLKTLHQTTSNSAFVNCYLSTFQEKKDYLDNILFKYDLQFDTDALIYAQHFLEATPELLAESCLKLSLYKTDKTPVSVKELIHCSTRPAEVQLEKLIAAIGDRCAKTSFEIYQQTQHAELEDIYLLRTLSSHFVKLLELKSKINNGMTSQQALNTIRPPLFFKSHDMFKRHLQKWNIEEMIEVLHILKEAELKLKTGSPYNFMMALSQVFNNI
jgi:DNA polymerase-3 subunit delta